MKKLAAGLAICFILAGAGFAFAEELPGGKGDIIQDKGRFHHLDEHLYESLIKKGYTKKEIFKAAHFARISGKEAEEILAFYKQSESSWEKTAEHFGVSIDKLNKHKGHFGKGHKLDEEKVIQSVSKYTGKDTGQLKKWIEDGISPRFLLAAAAMSKAADKDIGSIIKLKQEGKSLKEISESYNITHEQFHQEMKKLMNGMKEDSQD